MPPTPSKPIEKFNESVSGLLHVDPLENIENTANVPINLGSQSKTIELPFSMEDVKTGKLTEKKNLYTLFFRAGNNPHAMSKHFFLSGELRDVVIRAKKHCDTLGYRFVRIEPFISDLAADERRHTGSSEDVQS